MMGMISIIYCDGPECERQVQTGSTQPEVFITLTEGRGQAMHFCGWDCVRRRAAEKPPAEIISFGPD